MRDRKAFTLVEIMVVVGIIGLITALVLLPNVMRGRLNANNTVAQATLRTISNGLENYLSQNNTYPSDINLLVTSNPTYVNTDFFDGTAHGGFTYGVETLTDYSYAITATPTGPTQGTGSFTISTGGVLAAN